MKKTGLCAQFAGSLRLPKTLVCGFVINIANDHFIIHAKKKCSLSNQTPRKCNLMDSGSVKTALRTLLSVSVAKRRE